MAWEHAVTAKFFEVDTGKLRFGLVDTGCCSTVFARSVRIVSVILTFRKISIKRLKLRFFFLSLDSGKPFFPSFSLCAFSAAAFLIAK